jgi:hypothetical protein
MMSEFWTKGSTVVGIFANGAIDINHNGGKNGINLAITIRVHSRPTGSCSPFANGDHHVSCAQIGDM